MKLFIWYIIFVLLFFIGCSSGNVSKLKTVDFQGYSEVEKGESAILKWNIENASSVKILNLGTIQAAEDSIEVFPIMTQTYDFIAYNSLDTIKLSWQVKVIDTASPEIGKGFGRMSNSNDETSYLESEYLSGLNLNYQLDDIKSVKVMRKFFNDENALIIRTIALDAFGNYLPNLPQNMNWDIKSECGNSKYDVQINSTDEHKYSDFDNELKISLLVENSIIAGEQFPVLEYIESYLYSLNANDKLRIDYFNHNLQNGISLRNIDKLKNNPKFYEKPSPKGLNAYYKAAYQTLKDFTSEIDNQDKIMIIISFSPDNASIIYKANDIADLALSKNIPIYTIGIGSAVESYPLKYISDVSGGRNYYISEDELYKLPYVLNEISYSQKAYYELKYTLSLQNCDIARINVGHDNSNQDNFKTYQVSEAQYSGYQAVAAFFEQDTVVSIEYFENIRSLARVLKDNPTSVIELVGNSSNEGNYIQSNSLSLKRAQSTRRLLIEAGASSDQIRVRGEGNAQPLYYFQESEWQKYFNRRVEVRWLNPELLPYEIIADVVKSEEIALEKVESWENAGYRAYYKRYLINNLPVYRVKLWGYSTEEEAQNAATVLEKKYHISFVVQ